MARKITLANAMVGCLVSISFESIEHCDSTPTLMILICFGSQSGETEQSTGGSYSVKFVSKSVYINKSYHTLVNSISYISAEKW